MEIKYLGETHLGKDLKTYTIIHGGIYEAYYMHKDNKEVYLIGVSGGYNIELFETLEGNSINHINFNMDIEHVCMWKNEKLDEDDLFMCCSTKLKTLTYGKIYTLADSYSEESWILQFKDSKNKRNYGRNSFKRLSKGYVRTLKINDLLGDDNSMPNRFKHDGIPIIEPETKIDILLNTMNLAREYIRYTDIKGVSIMDILKLFKHHLIEDKDLETFANLNFRELLNEKL